MRERLIINLKAQFPRHLKFIGPYSEICTTIIVDSTCTEIKANWQARITRQKFLHLMLVESIQSVLDTNLEKTTVYSLHVCVDYEYFWHVFNADL